MNVNYIDKQVMECVASFSIDDNISPDDSLMNLGIDSLKIVELMLALEDAFGIEFDSSDLNPTELITVNDLIDLVNRSVTGGEMEK